MDVYGTRFEDYLDSTPIDKIFFYLKDYRVVAVQLRGEGIEGIPYMGYFLLTANQYERNDEGTLQDLVARRCPGFARKDVSGIGIIFYPNNISVIGQRIGQDGWVSLLPHNCQFNLETRGKFSEFLADVLKERQ
jgi:hypothetical protein